MCMLKAVVDVPLSLVFVCFCRSVILFIVVFHLFFSWVSSYNLSGLDYGLFLKFVSLLYTCVSVFFVQNKLAGEGLSNRLTVQQK